jgi:hypothetical protein
MTPFPALPQLVSGNEGMTTAWPRLIVVVGSEHQTIEFAESARQWTSVAILPAGSCPCNRPDDITLQQKVTVVLASASSWISCPSSLSCVRTFGHRRTVGSEEP